MASMKYGLKPGEEEIVFNQKENILNLNNRKNNKISFFKSIKGKLTLIILILSIIPLVAAISISIYSSTNEIEKASQVKNEIFLQQKINNINNWIEEKTKSVKNITIDRAIYQTMNIFKQTNYDINNPLYKERYAVIDNFVKSSMEINKDYLAISIYNSDRKRVYATKKDTEGGYADINVTYLNEALQGNFYIEKIEYNKFLKEPTLVFSFPIKSNGLDGEIIGSAGIAMSSKKINEIIAEGVDSLGKSGDAYLIDKEGMLLTPPKFELKDKVFDLEYKMSTIGAKDIINNGILKKESDYTKTSEYFDYRNEMVVGSNGILKIGNFYYGMIIELDSSEAFSAANLLKYFMFGILIITIVLVIIFAIIFANNISKPILQGVNVVKEVSVGDFNVIFDVNRNDEIQELAESINILTSNLKGVEQFAKSVAEGNFSIKMERLSDKDNLAPALNSINNTLTGFNEAINTVIQAAATGDFSKRIDANDYQGGFKDIAEGVNYTFDTVVEKTFWYESIIDSIPFPISVTDLDMNWTFINKPAEEITNMKRKDIVGIQCSNWGADICNTDRCGIQMMKKGELTSYFNQPGINLDFQVDTAYLYNTKDEKIGHIEIVQDITKTVKGEKYQKNEINKLSEVLSRMVTGDLTVNYHEDSADKEILELQENFKAISEGLMGALSSLNDILSQVDLAADQMSGASGEVANTSQSLASGASEQASSLEEISASVTEISGQTKKNAENADEANLLAKQARKKADDGNSLMQEMLSAMNDIKDSSSNISKIIKVIDEIAFQTNILSLNAAVEAARAGKHGKGFAVVAEEVRNLAQRSAKAAKETTDMIESSIIKVNNGTKISNETAESLTEIVEAVTKVTQLVEEIANSSREQTHGITELTQALGEVENVTQSTAASAEESASASEQLSSQAEQLKVMIKRFKINAINRNQFSHEIKKETDELHRNKSNRIEKSKNNDDDENIPWG